MDKIIYKALFPHFKSIFSITKVDTNKFEIISKANYSKTADQLVLKRLKEIGFYKDGEDLRVIASMTTNIDTWCCRKTIVSFHDWTYKNYNTVM